MKIGILSDTHGLFPKEFMEVARTCDYLIHAGDIGTEQCYMTLKSLGVPLYMIRGNCDRGSWCTYLPETLSFHIDGLCFYVIHNLMNLSYLHEEPDIIIFGHTHKRTSYEKRGTIYLNPGSAGRGRGEMNSMAILTIKDKKTDFEFISQGKMS